MELYRHTALDQLYINPHFQVFWPEVCPRRQYSIRFYARQRPDQGRPAQECGLVPVYEAMYTGYLRKIPKELALALDAHLVDFVQQRLRQHALARLQSLLSPGAHLFFRCDTTHDHAHHFDVYLDRTPDTQHLCHKTLVYLNELLAHSGLVPHLSHAAGVRLLAPVCDSSKASAELLATRLAVRVHGLWGEYSEATFPYSLC